MKLQFLLFASVACCVSAIAQAQSTAPVVITQQPGILVPAVAVETQTHTAQHPQVEDAADPVSLQIVYTADVWSNASGGLKTGTRYLDNVDVMLNADLDAWIGVPNTTVFLYGIYNNGKSFGDLTGDAQGISNIETGVKAARLYEAWVQHDFGKASIRAGLYDFNSEFDALDSSGLFMGSSHGIGVDIAQAGENGPSIFPSTSLGVRVDGKLTDTVTVRAAVLDGVPGDPAHPKRTAIKLGGGDGAFLAAEAVYDNGTSKIVAGYWRFTGLFEDRLASALSGASQSRRGNDGVYLRGEHWFYHVGGDENRGLRGFARIGFADGKFNDFARFYSLGAVFTGPFASRAEDQLGLAVAIAESGQDTRDVAVLGGSRLEAREAAIEFTYRAPLTKWLTVQPNMQYVINPGLDPTVGNVLAFGLRAELGWEF